MNAIRQSRNFWILGVTTIVLACFGNAVAQASYQVTDLGVLHDNWNLSCAMALNNQGWTLSMDGLMDPVSKFVAAPIVTGHAVINIGGLKIDLRTLGGPNSWMNWGGINDRGEAVGFAETSVPDPDGGSFCTSQGDFTTGTGLTCSPFLWQNGHISALPTLGGNNGSASDINNGGQIVGTAQTSVTDSGCPPNKTHLPVLWEKGKAQALPTVGSDPDGDAFWINDQGQAVGDSRNCSGAIIHAVSWENGTASQLPDFETGAVAYGNNNEGEIVGTVGSADGTTQYGALWQNGALTNLPLLPGDFGGIATGLNKQGQVVGSNWDSNFNWSHAFIWQNFVMTDLNTLFPASSNLSAMMANKINESGQISGMAIVLSGPHAGDIHAFLATPVNHSISRSVAEVARTHPISSLPTNVNRQLLPRFVLGPFGQ